MQPARLLLPFTPWLRIALHRYVLHNRDGHGVDQAIPAFRYHKLQPHVSNQQQHDLLQCPIRASSLNSYRDIYLHVSHLRDIGGVT